MAPMQQLVVKMTDQQFESFCRSYSSQQNDSVQSNNAAQMHLATGSLNTQVSNSSHAATEIQGAGNKKTTSANKEKSTRPLNSWIAFRSHYSTLFTSFPQKEISGLLTHLWQSDPFKGKWSMLAKAYSLIRDEQGKVKSPLDRFLVICGPFVGIIKPEDYLRSLGWEVGVQADGEYFLWQNTERIGELSTGDNVSVNGIIQHCADTGFFAGDPSNIALPNDETVITVGSGNEPEASAGSQGHEHSGGVHNQVAQDGRSQRVENDAQQNTGTDAGFANGMNTQTLMATASNQNASTTLSTQGAASSANNSIVSSVAQQPATANAAGASVPAHTAMNNTNPAPQTIAVAPVAPMRTAIENQEFYAGAFDPDVHDLHWDPYLRHQYDAINISDSRTSELVLEDYLNLEYFAFE